MPTCHSFLFLSFFYYFFSHANHSFKSDHFVHHDFNSNSSSAILLNTESRFSIMLCHPTLSTRSNSYASFKLNTVIHSLFTLFKCNSFCLSESTIPYCFFPSTINFRPVKSRKCFLVFLLLLSGDIQLNPGLLLSLTLMPLHHLMFMNHSHRLHMLNYVLLLLMLDQYPINLPLFVIT